jgi:hypothetical protein
MGAQVLRACGGRMGVAYKAVDTRRERRVVDLACASSNLLARWLRQIEGLRPAAACRFCTPV